MFPHKQLNEDAFLTRYTRQSVCQTKELRYNRRVGLIRQTHGGILQYCMALQNQGIESYTPMKFSHSKATEHIFILILQLNAHKPAVLSKRHVYT